MRRNDIVSETVIQTEEELDDGSHEQIANESDECIATTSSADYDNQHPRAVQVSVDGTTVEQVLLSSSQLRDSLNSTTHIVIHDVNDQLSQLAALKAAKQANDSYNLANSPTSSPFVKFRYDWSDAENQEVFSVVCKEKSGELYKHRLGSGKKGKCIYVRGMDAWLTPADFEEYAGCGNSKSWKRSIRYGGKHINCLIEDGILRTHAFSCTCSTCCNDDSLNGPIKYADPVKKRKRFELTQEQQQQQPDPKRVYDDDSRSAVSEEAQSVEVLSNVVECSKQAELSSGDEVPIIMNNAVVGTISIGSEPLQTESNEIEVAKSPPAPAPPSAATEADMWTQLQEMAKSFVNYGLELKQLVEQVRDKAIASREAEIHALKQRFELEKKQALTAARVESEMLLSRSLNEARMEKDIAIQQALNQARAEINDKFATTSLNLSRCVNCNREAVSKAIRFHNLTYCSIFCQKKDLASRISVTGIKDKS